MTYNYNGLWTLLADKRITKTEMRKRANISSNILAKMGKNEPISMESLAKIATSLNCGLDDIVEIFNEEHNASFKNLATDISSATLRNWKRLGTQSASRLTMRANKRNSLKRILPFEYFSNENNIGAVQEILDIIDTKKITIKSAVFSLSLNLLKKSGLYNKDHVNKVLHDYADTPVDNELVNITLPDDEYDIIGLIYQSYLQEGKKNITGSYYTPQRIVRNMTKDFDFTEVQEFFDPCCGSGAFLLSIPTNDPNRLYGVDNDELAVFIAKVNLLLKFPTIEFVPHIYCLDYLEGNSLIQRHFIFDKEFDYIATNPPWGAMNNGYVNIEEITSNETFSFFFVKAFEHLKDGGRIRFLFPQSILNVKIHRDIRKYILDKANLISIMMYEDMFSGVTTKYVDIECSKKAGNDYFVYQCGTKQRKVNIGTIYETDNLIFNLLNEMDISIIHTVKDRGTYSLADSIWALGIVTGDNKGKLFSQPHYGMEKIYTGKEIQPYILKPAQNYIVYDRNNLQQVARDDIYRAPEKLVYKFISNKLVFAYDDSKSLFLNSANILIPKVPNMEVKTVMAFLNSSLFQFMYLKLFGEVKILKGNLIQLPFPEITPKENLELIELVNVVLQGDKSKQHEIDDFVFSVYGLSESQITYVRRTVNGEID